MMYCRAHINSTLHTIYLIGATANLIGLNRITPHCDERSQDSFAADFDTRNAHSLLYAGVNEVIERIYQ